jgi:hypothetical protein
MVLWSDRPGPPPAMGGCHSGPGNLPLEIIYLAAKPQAKAGPQRQYLPRSLTLKFFSTTQRIALHYLFATAALSIYGGQV